MLKPRTPESRLTRAMHGDDGTALARPARSPYAIRHPFLGCGKGTARPAKRYVRIDHVRLLDLVNQAVADWEKAHPHLARRDDGTTAAERSFGVKPSDAFAWLRQRLPELPRPAAERPEPQTKPASAAG